MALLSFNNEINFINKGSSFARMLLTKIVSQLMDFICVVPEISDERINGMLEESNILEKLRYGTYLSLTSHNKVSGFSIEKNNRDRWVINVNEITYFEREDLKRLTRCRLLVNVKEINGWKNKLIREYFFKNGEVHIRYLTERSMGNETENTLSDDIFSGVKLNKEINLGLKVIPVILWKGHLGDGISVQDRIFELLSKADDIFNTFIEQQHIQGGKFLVNGSPVNSGNRIGETAESKIVKALKAGENVIVNYSRVSSNDKPSIEPVVLNTQLQEFRANLDWLLTAAKEYSLVPDFNGADKGTANIQTAEVEASMKGKNKHLQQWNSLIEAQWKELFNIYYLRSGNKEAKKIEIELDLTDEKKIEKKQDKEMSNQIKLNNENDKKEVKDNE